MNNFKYFIEREEQDKKKGLGDKYEGSFIMHNLDLEIYISETKEHIADAKASVMTLRLDYLLKKPMFCTTYLTSENLIIEDETKDEFTVSLDLNFLEKMKDDFGKHMLIINGYEFTNKLQKRFREGKISHFASKVRYSDFSKNDRDRFLSFGKKSLDMFFWKDIYFEYQQEHRLVVLEDHESAFIYDIGDISMFSEIIETKDLSHYRLSIIKKKEKS
ncbi:hypothetical protein PASE110613_17700 [Paenibacillus sediminis]